MDQFALQNTYSKVWVCKLLCLSCIYDYVMFMDGVGKWGGEGERETTFLILSWQRQILIQKPKGKRWYFKTCPWINSRCLSNLLFWLSCFCVILVTTWCNSLHLEFGSHIRVDLDGESAELWRLTESGKIQTKKQTTICRSAFTMPSRQCT